MAQTILTGISVCVFDAYGTLFDLQKITAAGRDVLGDRTEALSELWRRKQLEYTWLRSLMGRHTDFWHVTGESLDYALAAMGIDDLGLRAHLMEAYLSPPAYPETKETLEAMRSAGIKLGVLSNGSPTMLTSAVKHSNFWSYFDEVISVEIAGVFKPHPSVYRIVLDKFGCQPAQVAFVSANGWDAAGAAAVGFQVVWINRKGAPPEVLPAQPHAEIPSLGLLPEVVRP